MQAGLGGVSTTLLTINLLNKKGRTVDFAGAHRAVAVQEGAEHAVLLGAQRHGEEARRRLKQGPERALKGE